MDMDHYIDLLIKPDTEMRLNVLLNTVYTKLHKALCNLHATNIGASFPGAQLTLGNLLRLHGTAAALGGLQSLNWLDPMQKYCRQGEVNPVPPMAKFRTISRRQPTMSPAKLRRLIKRDSISELEVKNYKAKMFAKGLDVPYVELVSGSNSHRHRRYIKFGPLLTEPVDGNFDQFGLSKTATVPWF
jgi:CRISPR-associated endonuclease Csy4